MRRSRSGDFTDSPEVLTVKSKLDDLLKLPDDSKLRSFLSAASDLSDSAVSKSTLESLLTNILSFIYLFCESETVNLAVTTFTALEQISRRQFGRILMPPIPSLFPFFSCVLSLQSRPAQFFDLLLASPGPFNEFVQQGGLCEAFKLLTDLATNAGPLHERIWEHFRLCLPTNPGILRFLSFFAEFDVCYFTDGRQVYMASMYFRCFNRACKSIGVDEGFDRAAGECGAFARYIAFVAVLDRDVRQEFFQAMATSPEGSLNIAFVSALYGTCQGMSAIRQVCFEMFLPCYQDPARRVRLVKVFPVSAWFKECRIPLLMALSVASVLPKTDVIPLVFAALPDEALPDVALYIQCLKLAMAQPDDLSKIDFLDIVMVKPCASVLAGILSDRPSCDFMLAVFKGARESAQAGAFRAVLALVGVLPETRFQAIASKFLLAGSSSEVMEELVRWMATAPGENGCQILLRRLENSAQSAKHFLEVGGLGVLDGMLRLGQISEALFGKILASLVSCSRFDEVDSYVLRLPASHPLFTLPPEALDEVAFGMSTRQWRPIRVKGVLKLLDCPVDGPYNAWIIGAFVLQHWINRHGEIFKVPNISRIANRFLRREHAQMLLTRPYDITPFCDLAADHFPLFQFYHGGIPLVIKRRHRAMSFWFRFSEVPLDIVFFTTDELAVRLKENTTVIQMEREEALIQTDPTVWNHFWIAQTGSRVTVSIAGVTATVTRGSSFFTQAAFVAQAPAPLFIGATIRLYEVDFPDSGAIRAAGPGCTTSFHATECRVAVHAFTSPFSATQPAPKYCAADPNCFGVPYCGFPFHCTAEAPLTELFAHLSAAPTATDFVRLADALLNIQVIAGRPGSLFWVWLAISFKKQRDWVTRDLFERATAASAGHAGIFLLGSGLWDTDMCFEFMSASPSPDLTFLMHAMVVRTPNRDGIIAAALQDHAKHSHFLSFLRTAIMSPRNPELQATIVDCLTNYGKPNIINWVPWDLLKTLLACSPPDLGAKVFHLMAVLGQGSRQFVLFDQIVIMSLVHLSHSRIVWQDMLTGNAYPGLLALVWSVAVCLFFSYCCARGQYDTRLIPDDLYGAGLIMCTEHAREILESTLCIEILTVWIPSMLVYPYLRAVDGDGSTGLFPTIARILEARGFGMPNREVRFDNQNARLWLSSSSFTVFLAEILTASLDKSLFTRVVSAIVFLRPLCDLEILKQIAPPLVLAFLGRLVETIRPGFPLASFIQLMQLVAFHDLFADDPIRFLSDLIPVLVAAVDPPVRSIGAEVIALLLHVINASQNVFRPLVLERLSEEQGLLGQCYIKGGAYKPALTYAIGRFPTCAAFLPMLGLPKDKSLELEAQWTAKNEQFERDMRKVSEDVLRSNVACEHQFEATARAFSESVGRGLEMAAAATRTEEERRLTFTIAHARENWRQRLLILWPRLHWPDRFAPVSYHPSARVPPFQPHSLLSPSPFTRDELRDLARKLSVPSSSPSTPYLELFAMSFGFEHAHNCEIRRRDQVIPAVAFATQESGGARLLTYADLSNGVIKLLPHDPAFLRFFESVLVGEWGETTVYFSSIVLHLVPDRVLHARVLDGHILEIWSLMLGNMCLVFESASVPRVFVTQFGSRTSPISRMGPPNAMVESWVTGNLSDDELIYLLNASDGKSFADITRNPVLLEDADVPEFMAEHFPAVQIPLETGGRNRGIGDIDLCHLCQPGRLKCAGSSVELAGTEAVRVGKFEHWSAGDSPVGVQIRKKAAMMQARISSKTWDFSLTDAMMPFATGLAIARNGLFVVVDFEFGLARTFYIQCGHQTTSAIVPLSELSVSATPKSAVSGYFWIAATAQRRKLIMWEVVSGTIHRIVDLTNDITQVVADEEAGFWVVTTGEIAFTSVHSQATYSVANSEKVSAFAVLPLPARERHRAAVAGTGDGRLYLLNVVPDEGLVNWKQLPSEHQSPIRSILATHNLKEFITVDATDHVTTWSAAGLGPRTTLRGIQLICPMCGNSDSPLEPCVSCGRGLCDQCRLSNEDGHPLCGFCLRFTL
jgi:hypothetical protein